MAAENKSYSYHIFLFPFKWELKQEGKKLKQAVFSDLANLEIADKLVLQDERWTTDLYNSFNSHEDYNEFIFFYPFVRDVLYDYHADLDRNTLIRHYEFKLPTSEKVQYIINIKKDNKKYYLDVEYILLNLYKTGVGLLSYHLKNDKPHQLEWNDILNINEYGRRLYPQFLTHEFSCDVTKKSFLADSIEISNLDVTLAESFFIADDFEDNTGISKNIKHTSPEEIDIIPNHIDKILPQHFLEIIQHKLKPVIDDRMFVVSAFFDGNKKYNDRIKELKKNDKGILQSTFNKELYEYIFVDGPDSSGVGNDDFRDKLVTEHTYGRWVGKATFFGISRYSFVSYSDFFPVPVHTRTMYYKMAELCLVQRASVLNFTEEVSRISKLEEGPKALTQKLNDLYKNYIQFVNKIYFREVTAQEQGIELYDMLQKHMRLREEVKDLDNELGELHNYVSLLEEKERNRQLSILTTLGALFILPSFILTFIGSSDKIPEAMKRIPLLLFLAVVAISPLFIFSAGKSKKAINNKRRLRKWLLIILVAALFFFLLFYPKTSSE